MPYSPIQNKGFPVTPHTKRGDFHEETDTRHPVNLTAYEAVYVALAEALGATLLTCDGRLAQAAGIRTRIKLVHD